MLNTYPWWKNLLILLVLVVGGLYALPNIYPPDFAIQISTETNGGAVTEAVLKRAENAITAGGLKYKRGAISKGSAVIRMYNSEAQLKGKKLVQFAMQGLPKHYVVALNEAATTPQWLRDIGAAPMKYGLDLRGGIHFLLQVNTGKAIDTHVKQLQSDVKRTLRERRLRYRGVAIEGHALKISFEDQSVRDKALSVLRDHYSEFKFVEGHDKYYFVRATMTAKAINEIQTFAVSQNVQTIRNRVNELGVSEPLVQRLGANRIVVDLPGVQDATEAKKILGKVATLQFRLEAKPDAPPGSTLTYNYEGRKVELDRNLIITGDRVIDARVGYDRQSGMPQVNITLDSRGGERMSHATRHNVGRRMGVVFIETRTRNSVKMVDGKKTLVPAPYTTKRIISLATIQSPLGIKFRITGLSGPEAKELALLLRAGALAAPMYVVEERTVGASLGAQNIRQGEISVVLGLVLVLSFMLLVYRIFGIAADLALLANLVILVAVMSLVGATLTLPGIAGIVLTLGMAVDANVLINSRIREELANKAPPQVAINAGFERAFITILDSNLTTLLVGLILYFIGTGPVKGFAVTLSIGIVTSMFTAVMGTRAIINLIYGGRKVERLSIGS